MVGSKPDRVHRQAWLGIEAAADWYNNHAVKYVDGRVHTNTLENFWSLLKRGITGTLREHRAIPSVPVLG